MIFQSFCSLCLCVFVLLPGFTEASGIRKIVHPDGRIEYTNVNSKKNTPIIRTSKNKVESIYKYRKDNGVLTYSNLKPKRGVVYQTLKFECFACNPVSKINWYKIPLNRTAYSQWIDAASALYDVDPALVRAVIHAESAFNPKALSSQGAQGLMQLMPGTAKELGVKNAMQPAENIQGGVKYLSQMLKRFNGDTKLASAAYNAGPNAVDKYAGVPPYAETQTYVKRVEILRKRYSTGP